MTTKRPRNFDNQKLFIIVHNTEEFKQLQVSEGLGQQEDKESQTKKIDPIITPKVWKVGSIYNSQALITLPSGEVIDKKRKYNIGYLRVRREQFLPRGDAYELNDADYDYLKEYNQKNGSTVQTYSLEKLISELELKSGREATIELKDAVNLIYHKELSNQMSQKNFEDFYKYWRTKRERLQRSLLRQFWRATNDEQNQNIPFRPREKEKMKTRRTNRPNDQDTLKRLQELKKEFKKSSLLFNEIKVREKIKLDTLDLQALKFSADLYRLDKNSQFKLYGTHPIENQKDLDQQITLIGNRCKESLDLLKDINMQHYKMMNKTTPPVQTMPKEAQKQQQQEPDKIVTEQPQPKPTTIDIVQPVQQVVKQVVEPEDPTFDIAAFLSTVYIEANNSGITIENIFNPVTMPVPMPQDNVVHVIEPQNKPPIVEPKANPQPVIQPVVVVGEQPNVNSRNKVIYFGIRKRIIRNGLIVIDRMFSDEVFKPEPVDDKQFIYAKDSMYENPYMREKLDRFIKYVNNEDEEENEDETKLLKKNVKLAIQEFNKKKQKKGMLSN